MDWIIKPRHYIKKKVKGREKGVYNNNNNNLLLNVRFGSLLGPRRLLLIYM